jgi:hypothetical protein
MTTEYIELRPPMARWLKANAESRGLTLQELVAHILSSYQEEWEDLEENTEETENGENGEDEEA